VVLERGGSEDRSLAGGAVWIAPSVIGLPPQQAGQIVLASFFSTNEGQKQGTSPFGQRIMRPSESNFATPPFDSPVP
jgi:hypothetical protein